MSLEAYEKLLTIHEIQQLKYRYMRALDSQDWALMAEVLAEDINCWVGNGRYRMKGRQNFLDWIQTSMTPTTFTSHIVMHPEIELTSPTTATGKWRLQDIDYFMAATPAVKESTIKGGEKLEGAAYYHDEYVKIDGRWWIQSTGYIRLFEAIWRPQWIEGDVLRGEPMRGVKPPDFA